MANHRASPQKVLFVCLGNICRSPLAEGLFNRFLTTLPNPCAIEVDSAGTGDWHVGQAPDSRARREGENRGCAMLMRARQIQPIDFEIFDWIIAMDHKNVADLQRISPEYGSKVHLLGEFSSVSPGLDINDPYYGDALEFVKTADFIETCLSGLYEAICNKATKVEGSNEFSPQD